MNNTIGMWVIEFFFEITIVTFIIISFLVLESIASFSGLTDEHFLDR